MKQTENNTPLIKLLEERFSEWSQARSEREIAWESAWRNYMGQFRPELKPSEGEKWRSRVFFPLTKHKVALAVSNIADVVFQGGRFPFDIKNTPIPDSPDNAALKDLGFDMEERVKNMKALIEDQLIESKAEDQLYDCLLTAAIYGTACMRGPVVKMRPRNRWMAVTERELPDLPPRPSPEANLEEHMRWEEALRAARNEAERNLRFEMESRLEAAPAVEALDIWDVYPDPDCEGDIQKGLGVIYRSFYTEAELIDLTGLADADGTPVYNTEEIRLLLRERKSGEGCGDRGYVGPHRRDPSEASTGMIAVYEFAGTVTRRDLEGITGFDAEEGDELDSAEVIATFAEGRLLRLARNDHPAKIRPYHLVQWERIPGSPWGRGVAENMKHPQSMANGLLRTMLDNKTLSSNLMFAVDESGLENPSDLRYRPGFRFRLKPGFRAEEVVKSIVVPDISAGILDGLQLAINIADSASGVPDIVEGSRDKAPETAFAVEQKLSTALKQLGLVIRYFDERLIEPIVRSLYHWNMRYHHDNRVKGDFDIIATGFTSFHSKLMRSYQLRSWLLMASDNAEIRKKTKLSSLLSEYARTVDLDPSQVLLEEDEQEGLKELEEIAGRLAEENAVLRGELENIQRMAEGNRYGKV